MSIEKALDVGLIIERVKKCLNVKTNIELSTRLNIKQNTISAWKKRGNIDFPKIITICETTGVSMDWLLYGKGEKCVPDANNPTEKIMTMLESMNDEQRRDVLKYVEKEKLWEELIKKQKLA